MSASKPVPAPVVSRFTGLVLGFVVFICVTMIGGAGYLKYQLDRSEAIMAAPDLALGNDQDMLDRLRRNWGYAGFLGAAQSYIGSRDANTYAQMKAQIKSADEIVAKLPDKTSAETRHELSAISASFDNVLRKVGGSAGEGNGEFTTSDLNQLYAAMPIVDARINAANAETRLAAQGKTQFWSMLLTLVTWGSLIVAAACAAGIYLTLRDKHAAPMRALAQSIQNMARGDMASSIWGVERQDVVGELARAVDIARYHFSHLPDVSLISESGPVRMKFEGGSRSLFEAMMSAFSRDSEHIRTQSLALNETVTRQHESINALSGKVETILQNIAQRGQNGDQQLRLAISEMVGSTESLKNAHIRAADQLGRLIPHIEERAAGLAEITHITGKQITATLNSLTVSEIGLKANADHIKTTLDTITKTSGDLGERLFGAINLLQAGGKVLSETTEDLKLHLRDKMIGGGMMEAPAPAAPEISLTPLLDRLDLITAQIASVQNKMENPPAPAPVVMEERDTQQEAGIAVTLAALDQKISALAIPAPAPMLAPAEPVLPPEVMEQLSQIAQKLSWFEQSLSDTHRIIEEIKSTPAPVPAPVAAAPLPLEIQKQLTDQWFQMSAQIEASRTSLVEAISAQIDKLESRLDGKAATTLSRTATDYSTQRQIEQQTHILSELVATLGVLDEHMQQIKSEMHAADG